MRPRLVARPCSAECLASGMCRVGPCPVDAARVWTAEWLVRATALQTGVGLLTAENMQMMVMKGLVGMADSGYTGRGAAVHHGVSGRTSEMLKYICHSWLATWLPVSRDLKPRPSSDIAVVSPNRAATYKSTAYPLKWSTVVYDLRPLTIVSDHAYVVNLASE